MDDDWGECLLALALAVLAALATLYLFYLLQL